MDNYIKAGDFFNKLFSAGYCNNFIWQNPNPQTSYYNVIFTCKKCNPLCAHIIHIDVIRGEHLIKTYSVNRFFKKHNDSLLPS